MSDDFSSAVTVLRDLFARYSFTDVLHAILISELWLPNIASPQKHALLKVILLSLPREHFTSCASLQSYEAFCDFINTAYKALPQFVTIEDYVPEPDWGDVQYSVGKDRYRILYGTELAAIYDCLRAFEFQHFPLETEYRTHCERSPVEDLHSCLAFQNALITSIHTQPCDPESLEILPGQLQLPSREFWHNAHAYLSTFDATTRVSKDFAEQYAVPQAFHADAVLERTSFETLAMNGQAAPGIFVTVGQQQLILSPRNATSLLIARWGARLTQLEAHVTVTSEDVAYKMAGPLIRFMTNRLGNKRVVPLVNVVKADETHHELVYHAAFFSADKLLLIRFLPATTDGAAIQSELERLSPLLMSSFQELHASRVFYANIDKHGCRIAETLTEVVPVIVLPNPLPLVPKEFEAAMPGHLIVLNDFIAIIDSSDTPDDYGGFLDFVAATQERVMGVLSALDLFAAWKDSLGTLEPGAIHADRIALYPQWGSNHRFTTLKDFWALFPPLDFFGEPTEWRPVSLNTNVLRIMHRGMQAATMYATLRTAHLFVNAPYEHVAQDDLAITDTLVSLVADALVRRSELLEDFLKDIDTLQVLVVPVSLAREHSHFEHLRHLEPSDRPWKVDGDWVASRFFLARFVFDPKRLYEELSTVTDASREVEIALAALEPFLTRIGTEAAESLRQKFTETRSRPARFKTFAHQKLVSFPDFASVTIPTARHFKRAKKIIAEIASRLQLQPGTYSLTEGRDNLNRLRSALVTEINSRVMRLNSSTVLSLVIEGFEALIHRDALSALAATKAREYAVDYDPVSRRSKEHSDFASHLWEYRYLIEKILQFSPTGPDMLDQGTLLELLALIDWLHVIYSASDCIAYELESARVIIGDDFRVDVEYEHDANASRETFLHTKEALLIGSRGTPDDRIASGPSAADAMPKFDAAFLADLGFSLSQLAGTLHVLSNWAAYTNCSEAPSYTAKVTEVVECACAAIPESEASAIHKVIEFLTLRPERLLIVLGQEAPCDDLPVWEHYKRLDRYDLRPLVRRENDSIMWGPYSARRTGEIWASMVSNGQLPADLNLSNIDRAVQEEKSRNEERLVHKAKDIVQRVDVIG